MSKSVMKRRWQLVALFSTVSVLAFVGTTTYAAGRPSQAIKTGASYVGGGAAATLDSEGEAGAELGRRLANNGQPPEKQIPAHGDVMEEHIDKMTGRDSRAIRDKIRAEMTASDKEKAEAKAKAAGEAAVAAAQRDLDRAEKARGGDGGRSGGRDPTHTDGGRDLSNVA